MAWIRPCTRCDHDGYQIRTHGIDVRFDFIVSVRSLGLTAVNAIISHSSIKLDVEHQATMEITNPILSVMPGDTFAAVRGLPLSE
jgi:hypothetical protein